MAFTPKGTVVNQHENLSYAIWGGIEKPVLAGTGTTDWTEDASPNTDDEQYINEKNQYSSMTGYAPSISYSGGPIPDNAFVMYVYEVGKKRLIGEMFTAYEVEAWAPIEGPAGEFAAHRSEYEIQPSNPRSGEGGGKIAPEGMFAQKGDSLHGKYNIADGTFTEGAYDYKTGTFKTDGVGTQQTKIILQENTIPLDIAGLHFEMDADDITLYQTISDFTDKYRGNRLVTENFIDDCRNTIDGLLGVGAYRKIFHKDDLKPYYAILQLAEALKERLEEAVTTEQTKKRQQSAEKELQVVQGTVNSMERFTRQMEYADGKYGMKSVTNKRRPAKNRKSR